KLLLERLKTVEAENSSLVLENEQQRQLCENCHDDIAHQVVQALLAQKVNTVYTSDKCHDSGIQDISVDAYHTFLADS
ncbi:unnamed protein product, partial [Lymnaea stagnalis]